jgi:hypothetical protein
VDGRVVVRQGDVRARGKPAEVDDQVVPLGRRYEEVQHPQRGAEAAVRADQPERQELLPVGLETQPPETFVRTVENAQPVAAGPHLQIGIRLPVDDGSVRAFHAGHGVGERTVLVERPVLEDERDLELAAREAEPLLGGVVDQPEPGQARVDVEAGDPHGVVVVPEHRRALAVGVGVDRLVGRGIGRVEGGVRRAAHALGAEPLRRRPIGLRRGEAAVLVDDVPHVHVRRKGRHPVMRRRRDARILFADAVQHELEHVGSGREFVAVFDDRRTVPGRADRRPEVAHSERLSGVARILGPITPRGRGRKIAVEAPLVLPHRELVVVGARMGGFLRNGRHQPGQRVDVLPQGRGHRRSGASGAVDRRRVSR